MKYHTYGRISVIFIIIISLLIMTPLTAASELDDFETAATTENDEQKSDNEEDEEDENEDDDEDCNFFLDICEWIIEVAVEVFSIVIHDGAKMSLARVDESTETDSSKIEIRQTGEPTLPFFQYEHKYLRVSSDISARDDSLEVGYGPYGFNCRHTDYCEENPSDELSLTQYHFLLRISANDSREYGIGIGRLYMRGNEDNSGFSITFPVKIYPSESFGIRIKPTYSWINGNAIDEYDLSVAYTKRYGSLQLGYRFLEADDEDLNGSYVGFAVHY